MREGEGAYDPKGDEEDDGPPEIVELGHELLATGESIEEAHLGDKVDGRIALVECLALDRLELVAPARSSGGGSLADCLAVRLGHMLQPYPRTIVDDLAAPVDERGEQSRRADPPFGSDSPGM